MEIWKLKTNQFATVHTKSSLKSGRDKQTLSQVNDEKVRVAYRSEGKPIIYVKVDIAVQYNTGEEQDTALKYSATSVKRYVI